MKMMALGIILVGLILVFFVKDWEKTGAFMITPGFPDIKVEILKDMPYGLGVGDIARYEVRIIGTDKICWPAKTSIRPNRWGKEIKGVIK